MVIIIIIIIVFLGPQESCIALHIATQSASRRSLPSQHKPATGTRKLQARPREEPKHRGGRRTAVPCVRASVRPSIALHCTSLVNGTTMDTEAVAELLRSELAAADALLEIFATQHADPTQQAHILDHIRYDAASRSCEDDACTHTDRIHPPSLGQLRTAPHRTASRRCFRGRWGGFGSRWRALCEAPPCVAGSTKAFGAARRADRPVD